MIAGLKDRLRCKLKNCYPGPRGFFFSPHERAAREPRSGENEKPLVTLDLNLTFMQTLGSGSDPRARIGWYCYKRENKYDWSVWLAIPRRRWGYLSLHFWCLNFCLYLYQGKNLFAKYFSSQFIHVQDSAVFDIDYISDSVFEYKGILTLALEVRFKTLKFSPNIKALLAVMNRKDVFVTPPTGHGKSIIIQLITDVSKYLYLSGYSYSQHVINLVIIIIMCVLLSLYYSLWWTLKSANSDTVAFQRPIWAVKTSTSTICSKMLIPFYSEVSRPSYKTRSGETCPVVMFNKTEPLRSIIADENILANTHIFPPLEPGQVG